MDEHEEESWSPEKDKEPDEIMNLAKKLLGQSDKLLLDKKNDLRNKSFSEISVLLKRAWEETRKIGLDAPPHVQAYMLACLMHGKDR